MGWSYGWDRRKDLIEHLTKTRSHKTTLQAIGMPDHEASSPTVYVMQESLKHCFRGGAHCGVLWAVQQIEYRDADAVKLKHERYILCCLTNCHNKEWGYKDMDESMGPHQYSCPKTYLDMAPVADPKWREEVIKYHEKIALKTACTKAEKRVQRDRVKHEQARNTQRTLDAHGHLMGAISSAEKGMGTPIEERAMLIGIAVLEKMHMPLSSTTKELAELKRQRGVKAAEELKSPKTKERLRPVDL